MRVREGGLLFEIVPVRHPATLLLAYYRVSVLSTFGGEHKLLFEEKVETLKDSKLLAEVVRKKAEAPRAKGAA